MKDKVVIITGASSGIGKACAVAFAKEGANVVLASRDAEKLKQVVDGIKIFNSNAMGVTTDVSKEKDCENLINAAISKFGKIDVLINNAGVSMRALFEEVDLNVIRKVMDVNFWGTVYCSKYALPYLLNTKGSLLGISSIAGKKGLPGRTGYAASKFAMEGFLETVRIENMKKNLHVLVVCPGFTATGIRNAALGKDGSQKGASPRNESSMMTADEVAAKIVSAVKKRKRDLILTREGKLTIMLDKLFPAFVDKMVYNHMAKEPDSPFK